LRGAVGLSACIGFFFSFDGKKSLCRLDFEDDEDIRYNLQTLTIYYFIFL